MQRIAITAVIAASAGLLPGCGSGSGPSARAPSPRPDVAGRVVQGDELLGLPAVRGLGDVVRTDPALFSADSPGLYSSPERAVAELRRDGFVAGITRTFKVMGHPDGASSTVVQMRDAAGARAELRRELASAQAPPCPAACTRRARRFDVPGIPGAAGVQLTMRMAGQVESEHPDVLRSQAVLFRTGRFVHQLWLGAAPSATRRSELIAAARAQAGRRASGG